ncbi:E3 ubiquitin-protein ligase TRIM39-like [Protopterus annectens]|uniref:E3 ubiquitin-protein ligase TRIM39-like n=1 Tax=Protopterus annectens TaxID=7888 RepID=UPI001CFC3438|nr:E3 ubiquitin-protein ligase TRIM39-like [Protopterus annectens]
MQNLCTTNGRTEQCCGEHRERLELFCQEDESFICVLCVPRHSCHNFVFLHEAVSVYKDKIKVSLSVLESKPNDLRNLANKKEKELGDLQEEVCSLEQYITHEFAKLHQFLHDKEQKLIQQLKDEEAEILRQTEKKLESEDVCSLEQYITQEFVKLHQFLHEKEQKLIQLLKDEEAEIQRQMEKNLESVRNDIMATHVPVSDASLELRKKVIETLEEKEESTLGLKKVIETLEEKEESTLGLKKIIETLEEKEESTLGLKKVIETLEEKEESTLGLKKVIETLEEKEERTLGLKTSVMATLEAESKDMSELINQKTTGFLTAPETFEDVAVTFSEEEWKMLTKQDRELHKEVMVQNYESLVSVGYKILPEKLLLLLKQDSDEQPKCDVEGKHITKQQGNQEGGFNSK